MPETKNLSFLPSVLGYLKAKNSNFDDALFVYDGIITEGTTFNVFMVKDGVIKTNSNNILKGITQEKVIKLAQEIGFKVIKEKIKIEELLNADEVFITGTTKRVVPVVQINKKKINKGEVGKSTQKIMKAFSEKYF